MIRQFLIFTFLLCAFGTPLAAQSAGDCADLVKRHLATLDEHLDLDFKQMKCLKEKATTFCSRNRTDPPTSAAQRETRLKAMRKAILECLSEEQKLRVTSHYRNKRDERARRNLLQAFLEEFGDQVIIVKKQ